MRKVSPVLFFVLLFCLILCSSSVAVAASPNQRSVSVSIAASPNQPQTSLNESMNLLDGLQKRVDSRVDEKLQSEYAKLEIGHKNVDRWLTYMWTAMAILFTVIAILAAYQIFNFIQKTKEAEKHLIEIENAKDRVKKISDQIDGIYKDAQTQKSEMEKKVLEPILEGLLGRLFYRDDGVWDSFIHLSDDELKQLREISQEPFFSVEMTLTVSALLSAHNSKYNDSLGYFHQLYTLYPDSARYALFYAVSLNSLGFYDDTESVLKSALEKTKSDDAEIRLLCMSILAETLIRKEGRESIKEAEDIYKNMLTLSQEVHGKENPNTLMCMGNLARVYGNQGLYKEALKMYEEALAISKKVLGKEAPVTAMIYNNLAFVYRHQGNYAEALERYKEALAICENVPGKEHPDTATIYNNMAVAYSKQRLFSEALECNKKALYIREKTLGKDHPDTAATYNNIAVAYSDLGDYAKALEYSEKAVEIFENVFGKNLPATADAYNTIAVVYGKLKEYTKAIEYSKKALAIRENVLGEEHPLTLVTMNNLASLLADKGDAQSRQEAEALKQKIQDILSKTK